MNDSRSWTQFDELSSENKPLVQDNIDGLCSMGRTAFSPLSMNPVEGKINGVDDGDAIPKLLNPITLLFYKSSLLKFWQDNGVFYTPRP